MPGTPLHLGLSALDLSSELASCSAASPSCESNVHSARDNIESPSKVAMENMYSTSHALRGDGNAEKSPVKCQGKNNFIQTVWNNISETLTRNIMFNMNNELSVTVVNKDIIGTNFFEHSAELKKQPVDEPYNFEEKKSFDMKQIPQRIADLKPVDAFKPFIMEPEKFLLYYNDPTTENYMTWTNESETVEDSTESTGSDSNAMESHWSYDRQVEESTNFCPMDVDLEEHIGNREEKTSHTNEDASIIAAEMAAKRSKQHHWKKTTNAVATGRGRGRAKPQLRRSGVSQTSHRKQHGDNFDLDIPEDYEAWQILKDYQSMGNDDFLSNKPGYFDAHGYDDADGYDVTDDAQPMKEAVGPVTLNSSDLRLSTRDKSLKEETWQGAAKSPLQCYLLNCSITSEEDYESEKFPRKDCLRSRLLSESSVDSEDSFCILFEPESEADNTVDIDCDETSSSDQNSEDDSMDTINEEQSTDGQPMEESKMEPKKVKFNPIPIVHVMVHWSYAYRAARSGPWERIARDNSRFRGRINATSNVLIPILQKEHRLRIWQERFADQE